MRPVGPIFALDLFEPERVALLELLVDHWRQARSASALSLGVRVSVARDDFGDLALFP